MSRRTSLRLGYSRFAEDIDTTEIEIDSRTSDAIAIALRADVTVPADGQPIARATGATLRLKGPQIGRTITVQVTASAAGHLDATAESEPTVPVATGKPKGVGRG